MSVLEDLQHAQQAVLDRLSELEPLVSEYEQLRTEAARLGLLNGEKQAAPARSKRSSGKRSKSRRPAKTTGSIRDPKVAAQSSEDAAVAPAKRTSKGAAKKPAASPKRRAGQSRQQPGGRTEDILRLVAQRPGLTIKDIGTELKVNPTGLYRPVRELIKEGRITKEGTTLQPTTT